MKKTSPDIPPDLLEKHQALEQLLLARYTDTMPFDIFMEAVLYMPGLGYYSSNNQIFGSSASSSDFITAPNLGNLFGSTLSLQIKEVLDSIDGLPCILEFGAGNGDLAYSIISELQQYNVHPKYYILELSADLQKTQKQRLDILGASVTWLTELPDSFLGCIIANEVLDAMPCKLVENTANGWFERSAHYHNAQWELITTPLNPKHLELLPCSQDTPLGYKTEIFPLANQWTQQISRLLHTGVAFFIDYGFPAQEFWHPERSNGTLMCHFRHRAHSDPFWLLGSQDITAHVNFSCIADNAFAAGADILGYTNQSHFLLNLGILDIMTSKITQAPELKTQLLSELNYLLSEAEMGELFKVIAIGKNTSYIPKGFSHRDKTHTL